MEQTLFKTHYTEKVIPALMEKFGLNNPHVVPSISKIVINSGFDATSDKHHVAYVNEEINKIAGQSSVITKANPLAVK
jgi:large subunit ribosomal protein L5